MCNIVLLFLLATICQAWPYLGGNIPSCLTSGITSDQSNLIELTVNCLTPEECQDICASREDCKSFTWVSEDSPIFPNSCGLYNEEVAGNSCDHCVSGSRECPCTIQGECVSEENMIEAFPNVGSAGVCELLCQDNPFCNFFTYFEPTNALSHLCLLFGSCKSLDQECQDCVTGSPECKICGYEETISGRCEGCTTGWISFGIHCYRLIDNDGTHYNGIFACTENCKQAGGLLASIHSSEENDFITTMLRTENTRISDQSTYIGAEYVSGSYVGDFSFQRTDGTDWDYSNWSPGEPNGNRCVFLGYDPKAPNQWFDGLCDFKDPVFDCICKYGSKPGFPLLI